MRQALQRIWQERTRRERRVIVAAATLLGASLFYAYLWLPMTREHERLMIEVPRLRAEHLQIRADAEAIERVRERSRAAPQDLKALLQGLPGPKGATIAADAGGRVRVDLAKVRADEWVAWIAALQAENGVRLESARIEALGEPGTVKVTATLAGGGG